jgi:Uma2 family endonuclease
MTFYPGSAPVAHGEVIAQQISEDDYMALYAEHFCEWIQGTVIKMSPVTAEHDDLTIYLRQLLNAYFALRPLGFVKNAPFVMQVAPGQPRREPDLQVILEDRRAAFTETAMLGPATIVIEVISNSTRAIDFGDKFTEYETGGVQEYWLLDPLRQEAHFYRRNAKGIFMPQGLSADQDYLTPLLPDFGLHVPTLWQAPLPGIIQVVQQMTALLQPPP